LIIVLFISLYDYNLLNNLFKKIIIKFKVRAEVYLKKSNLETVNGKINELMDLKKKIYRIPNYCINLPFLEKTINSIEENHEIKKMSLILYDFYENKKTNINISDNIKIEEIKQRYSEHNKLDLKKIKLRLLFGGAELKDENYLYQYNFQENYIIQILKINIQ